MRIGTAYLGTVRLRVSVRPISVRRFCYVKDEYDDGKTVLRFWLGTFLLIVLLDIFS
jgi:hypothetical protein